MFVFYAHGGSDNHGCEAIVRGTCENLKGDKILYSGNAKADCLYEVDNVAEVRPDAYKRYYHPVKWFVNKVYNTIFRKNSLFYLVDGKEKGTYLSVGGDNYCYADLVEPVLKANSRIRMQGNQTILWGTSIESYILDNEQILKDISQYDYIFARESLTYEALVNHGLKRKTFLYPDPAFAMKPERFHLQETTFEKKTVGINISPMILKFEDSSNVIRKGYELIIQYLIENTDVNILLIPHVVKKNNDDREAIDFLQKKLESKRIFTLEDMAASKIKYVISRCDFFVGARTHSTIAAYSSCVPTLVVGYSVKAQGIAKDIFGTTDNYVVDVRNLKDADKMLDAFRLLYLDRENIRKYLKNFIPEYVNRTRYAAEKLMEIS